jgi:hypothetical protein
VIKKKEKWVNNKSKELRLTYYAREVRLKSMEMAHIQVRLRTVRDTVMGFMFGKMVIST